MAGANPLGAQEGAAGLRDPLGGADLSLRVDAILAKWEANSVGQDYSVRTRREYRWRFGRFAEDVDLSRRDRKWLATQGHNAIIGWVMGQTEGSRRVALAALESVWRYGLPDIPWPVDRKRDFGRRALPPSRQRECPTDADMEPIFRALEHEDDPYVASLVCVAMNSGPRDGNQAAQFLWSDVIEWNGLLAIHAESRPGRRFKTDSPVIARLPPLASAALNEWKDQTPHHNPDDCIWPRRVQGVLTNRMADCRTMGLEWTRFLQRHDVRTWIKLAHLRHWVEYRGQQEGIPSVLLAYLRGHAVKSATEGQLGYSGNRKVDKVLADQEAAWPAGPCGVFLGGEVRVVDELAPYMSVVAEYSKGRMPTGEMAARMEGIRLKSFVVPPAVLP